MTRHYPSQIAGAIAATVFHSRTSFSWCNDLPFEIPAPVLKSISPEETRNLVLLSLQNFLYENFYCLGFASPRPNSAQFPILELESISFSKELARANHGKGYSEGSKWRVKQSRENEITVARDGLELVVRPEELVPPAKSPRRGTLTTLRSPQSLLRVSPGFYMALGDKDLPKKSSKVLNRFYWNLTAPGAATFIRAVTSTFNSAALPFRVKVANHPSRFSRCDAGVLYLPIDDFQRCEKLLQRIYKKVSPYLKQGTPALTKSLAPGLGWAEDPPDPSGFGMHRCSLIAEGILRAYEAGKKTPESRLKMVATCFKEAGISLDHPYLNSGSRAQRALETFGEKINHSLRGRAAFPRPQPRLQPRPGASRFLEISHQIGRQIVQDALWHEDQCNWLGAEPQLPDPKAAPAAPPAPMYRALGPGLYAGTSGVALFLGELYAATGDADLRRAACGAISHSLSRLDVIPPENRFSLFNGFPGIAVAAARVGIATRREELLHRASAMLRKITRGSQAPEPVDFLSGKAGTITGLLVLSNFFRDPALVQTAARLADALLKQIEKPNHGASPHRSTRRKHSLSSGFSEGISGIAYALFELFRVSGESRYRVAAENALAQEDNLLQLPDRSPSGFRSKVQKQPHRSAAPQPQSSECSWSHGWPGIALSRIQAFEILKDARYIPQALRAIAATSKSLEEWLLVERNNFSLGRGLAGNAEVLLYASEVLGNDLDARRSLALQVAHEAAANHSLRASNSRWGPGTGETPTLMTGMAGVGYFYLRLCSPAILSPLTWKRSAPEATTQRKSIFSHRVHP
jgi:hypothetical protein